MLLLKQRRRSQTAATHRICRARGVFFAPQLCARFDTFAAVAKHDGEVRWLYAQLPELVTRGVLSEESAAALRQHYGPLPTRTGVSLLLAITAVLGALLIGAGIILVLGANWDLFPRAIRTAIAFVPLLASQILGAFVLLRRAESMGWRESVALLNSLAVAAAIALVSQIYHMPGDFVGFMLVWMLLTLPAIYLLKSAAATLLYLWLAMTWTLSHTTRYWPWGWLLFGVVMPFIVPMIRRGGLRAWWLAMAAMISGAVLLGATADQAHVNGIWMPAFAGYVGMLYVAGVALRPDELHPFRWLGFAAIGVLALVFTYAGFWDARTFRLVNLTSGLASVVCGIALLAGAAAAVLAFVRRVPVNPFAAAFPFVALLAHGVSFTIAPWTAALLMNLYVLALSIQALRSGLLRGRFAETNAGMFLITALIVMRFFDTNVGFLLRGLAFIGAGVGFLAINIILLKRRRAEA